MRRGDPRFVRFACVGLVPLFGIAFACSHSDSPPPAGDPLATGSVDERRAAAEKEFRAELVAVDSTYSKCKDQLKTAPTCSGATQSLGLFDGLSLCPVLRPFKGLLTDATHPYFFYGLSGVGGTGGVKQIGVDFVWDFWNRQAAAFAYSGGGIASIVGVEGSAYAGYGFGNKSGVIDAWSGVFVTGSASVGLPFHLASAGGSIFTSPDRTVYGGAASVALGFDFKPTPFDGSISGANWVAWDQETEALTGFFHFVKYEEAHASDGTGTSRLYLQFGSSRDLALGLLWAAGPLNLLAPIPTAVGVGILRRTGLTADQLCPDDDAGTDAAVDAAADSKADGADASCPGVVCFRPDNSFYMCRRGEDCGLADGGDGCRPACCLSTDPQSCRRTLTISNAHLDPATMSCVCDPGFREERASCNGLVVACQ